MWDLRAIENSITANLTLTTSHVTLRVNLVAPDLEYASLFAARSMAQRRYGRRRRRRVVLFSADGPLHFAVTRLAFIASDRRMYVHR